MTSTLTPSAEMTSTASLAPGALFDPSKLLKQKSKEAVDNNINMVLRAKPPLLTQMSAPAATAPQPFKTPSPITSAAPASRSFSMPRPKFVEEPITYSTKKVRIGDLRKK